MDREEIKKAMNEANDENHFGCLTSAQEKAIGQLIAAADADGLKPARFAKGERAYLEPQTYLYKGLEICKEHGGLCYAEDERGETVLVCKSLGDMRKTAVGYFAMD